MMAEASLILVNTHGRSGFKRFVMGSFAETLLLRSRVPVFVVSSKMRGFRPIKDLLFPTDFGVHSKSVFKQAVSIATRMKASLTIFHSVLNPVEPFFQSGIYLMGGNWIPIQPYFGNQIESFSRKARAWAKWASHKGVPTETVMQVEGQGVAAQIVQAARDRQTSFIVMAAQSGPTAAALIGSVTRQVIRNAECPVWVLREDMKVQPEIESESKSESKEDTAKFDNKYDKHAA